MSSRSFVRRLIGIPWPPLLAVTLILSLGVALVVRRTVETRKAAPTGALTILVSGDTQGLVFPAECTIGQAGGMTRRGEIVRQARDAGPVLYAELGNAPAGNTAYDHLKFAAILRGEMAMGMAAHNLGPAEVRLGVDELHRLASELKVPFISTNVRDAHGRPLAEPLRLLEAAGRRIAVAGLLSPRYVEEGLEILDPATAIEQALAEKSIPYDSLLVLAYLPADELSQLAARLPNRAVLVGPSHTDTGDETGANVAGAVGAEGRSLVRIDFSNAADQRWTARDVIVAPPLPQDPRQVDILVSYHRDLAEHDFPPTATGLAMPLPPEVASTGRVAGTHTCRACHAAECADWDVSRHARAWQSLVNRGVHYDAACQRCHTTGYGWEEGFHSAERSIGTVSVGCESCHGPALAHVLNPSVRTPLAASQQCTHCHDAQRSPGFDYTAAWLRIQHGPAPAVENLPHGARRTPGDPVN